MADNELKCQENHLCATLTIEAASMNQIGHRAQGKLDHHVGTNNNVTKQTFSITDLSLSLTEIGWMYQIAATQHKAIMSTYNI